MDKNVDIVISGKDDSIKVSGVDVDVDSVQYLIDKDKDILVVVNKDAIDWFEKQMERSLESSEGYDRLGRYIIGKGMYPWDRQKRVF